jgi:hypothetical protein
MSLITKLSKETNINMEFKLRYKRELIASLIGIIIAFYLLDFYGVKNPVVVKCISAIAVLLFLIGRYFYYGDEGYIIENDKIIIKNSKNRSIRISKIKCINQEWISSRFSNSKGSSAKYYIILKNSRNKLAIDLTFRNNKGQTLLTVLESKFDIKVNRVV